ncbi:MAG: hypothetical protein AMJ81_11505 [Phycisphaerae bacterium SM23_33]|nr:MAG: hypothetical protein AMJ81_11505 [Phycisphaerae bacterium SM23_33]
MFGILRVFNFFAGLLLIIVGALTVLGDLFRRKVVFLDPSRWGSFTFTVPQLAFEVAEKIWCVGAGLSLLSFTLALSLSVMGKGPSRKCFLPSALLAISLLAVLGLFLVSSKAAE